MKKSKIKNDISSISVSLNNFFKEFKKETDESSRKLDLIVDAMKKKKRDDRISNILDPLTVTLFRPVSSKELDLIIKSEYTKFPPRLPQQPIFYPVLNEDYATQISRDWNLPAYGAGYVTTFEIKQDYIKRFEIKNVGAEGHDEYWIPSEQLDEFNDNIVGTIRVVKSFISEDFSENI